MAMSVTCTNQPLTATSPIAPSVPPAFPVGTYSCQAGVGFEAMANGVPVNGVDSPTGTLQLTQSGDVVTASFAFDQSVAGTFDFAAITPTYAAGLPSPMITMPCVTPSSAVPPPPPTNPTFAGTTSSLVVVGSTLFVSFTGNMGSVCYDTIVVGDFICAM